jgi:hypothetical protein
MQMLKLKKKLQSEQMLHSDTMAGKTPSAYCAGKQWL